ncbi:hypothetical protein KIPB_006231 [Kipferlia bialata]|uniref:UvrD-like helicase ATP-binding domain-containing protein n=1 Tax=Kipferlia bialata TaxID=797122 RepID=A0A9K3GJP0_9EUKA|nr:hypothetical protein KIPB_005117 [Kipferlia bialata]GIQ84686.1 hypothetical protein KIPB_006231 [Kipferlia bialata]|eukprot:g5117.t1
MKLAESVTEAVPSVSSVSDILTLEKRVGDYDNPMRVPPQLILHALRNPTAGRPTGSIAKLFSVVMTPMVRRTLSTLCGGNADERLSLMGSIVSTATRKGGTVIQGNLRGSGVDLKTIPLKGSLVALYVSLPCVRPLLGCLEEYESGESLEEISDKREARRTDIALVLQIGPSASVATIAKGLISSTPWLNLFGYRIGNNRTADRDTSRYKYKGHIVFSTGYVTYNKPYEDYYDWYSEPEMYRDEPGPVSKLADEGRHFVLHTTISEEAIQRSCDTLHLESLTEAEMEFVSAKGSALAIGRAGCGKTAALIARMLADSAEVGARTLFISLSPNLVGEVHRVCTAATQSETGTPSADEDEGLTSHLLALPNQIHSLTDDQFPLFTTLNKLLLMLDGSCQEPFFPNAHGTNPSPSDMGTDGHSLSWDALSFFPATRCAISHTTAPKMMVTWHKVGFEGFKEVYPQLVNNVKQSWKARRRWTKGDDSRARRIPPAEVCWHEIVTHVTGSFSVTSGGESTAHSSLSKDDQSDVMEIYRAWENYKKQFHLYDRSDWVRHIVAQYASHNGSFTSMPVDRIYFDEVQDVPQCIIGILFKLCPAAASCYFMVGDTAQAVTRGVGFRFCDLRESFYHMLLNNRLINKSTTIPPLIHFRDNFRATRNLVRISAVVAATLQQAFPDVVDRLATERPRRKEHGDVPSLCVCSSDTGTDSLLSLVGLGGTQESTSGYVEFGSHQVILYREEGDLTESTRLADLGKLGLSMSVSESKGLEFDEVILVNYFSKSRVGWDVWATLSSGKAHKAGAAGALSHAERMALCHELKVFYVAISRARDRLILVEEDESVVSNNSLVMKLVERGFVEERPLSVVVSSSTTTTDTTPMGTHEDGSFFLCKARDWVTLADSLLDKACYSATLRSAQLALSTLEGWEESGAEEIREKAEVLQALAQAYQLAESASERIKSESGKHDAFVSAAAMFMEVAERERARREGADAGVSISKRERGACELAGRCLASAGIYAEAGAMYERAACVAPGETPSSAASRLLSLSVSSYTLAKDYLGCSRTSFLRQRHIDTVEYAARGMRTVIAYHGVAGRDDTQAGRELEHLLVQVDAVLSQGPLPTESSLDGKGLKPEYLSAVTAAYLCMYRYCIGTDEEKSLVYVDSSAAVATVCAELLFLPRFGAVAAAKCLPQNECNILSLFLPIPPSMDADASAARHSNREDAAAETEFGWVLDQVANNYRRQYYVQSKKFIGKDIEPHRKQIEINREGERAVLSAIWKGYSVEKTEVLVKEIRSAYEECYERLGRSHQHQQMERQKERESIFLEIKKQKKEQYLERRRLELRNKKRKR